jgi:plastocyanin
MTRRATRIGAAAAVAGAWLALAGIAGAADRGVRIYDFTFGPGELTIEAGDTVTWRNTDRVNHTATGTGWTTGTLTAGASATVAFDEAGTFPYGCRFHPGMTATVVVRVAGNGESDGGGAGDRGGDGGATAPATDAAPAAGVDASPDPGGWAPALGLLVASALAGAGAWLARPVRARVAARGRGVERGQAKR